MSQSCCKRKRADKSAPETGIDKRSRFSRGTCPAFYYLPPKIIQSPCDVPMSNSNGSDSQAFVREATKA